MRQLLFVMIVLIGASGWHPDSYRDRLAWVGVIITKAGITAKPARPCHSDGGVSLQLAGKWEVQDEWIEIACWKKLEWEDSQALAISTLPVIPLLWQSVLESCFALIFPARMTGRTGLLTFLDQAKKVSGVRGNDPVL